MTEPVCLAGYAVGAVLLESSELDPANCVYLTPCASDNAAVRQSSGLEPVLQGHGDC